MKRFRNSFAAVVLLSLIAGNAANAMDVSFEQDDSLPIVQINLALKAGAITDPDGQSGMTNFMGEMLLRGTRSKTKEQIDLALDQMGAKLDVETRAESMIFRGAVLASQLDPFLNLMAEIVTQPSFPEQEIRKLKSEIISGLMEEQGNDRAIQSKKFQEFLFNGHPYGKPIMGKIKDVENFNRAKVAAQYERYLHDKNLLVVGTGQASKGRIGNWAESIAKRLPTGKKPVVHKVDAPNNAAKRRLLVVDKPDRTQTQMSMGQIGVLMTDDSFFPLYVGNHAFGGGTFSSTLMVEVRVKRGWSYGAGSAFRFGLEPRSWHSSLFPASKDAAPALGLTLGLIEKLRNDGINAEEFDFAQRSLVNSAGFNYNTPAKRVENTLLEKTLELPEGYMKSYGPRIAQVSRDQVNQALKGFLHPDRLAITVLGTAKDLKEPLAKAAGVPVEEVVVQPYTAE